MPQVLSNIKLDEVAVVDNGANPGAEIKLLKRKEIDKDNNKQEETEENKEVAKSTGIKEILKNKIKVFKSFLMNNMAYEVEAQEDEDAPAMSFNDKLEESSAMAMTYDVLNQVDKLYNTLCASLYSIMDDPEVADKPTLIQESIKQFQDAIQTMLDESQVNKQSQPQGDSKMPVEQTEEVTKSADVDIAKRLQEIEKQNEEFKKKAQEQEAVIAKMQDEKETQEFISKAANYQSLPIEKNKLGLILKEASRHLSAEANSDLMTLIEACNKSLNLITKQFGSDNGATEVGVVNKLNAMAQEIAKQEGISFEKAFVKAQDQNPELKKQLVEERRARVQ